MSGGNGKKQPRPEQPRSNSINDVDDNRSNNIVEIEDDDNNNEIGQSYQPFDYNDKNSDTYIKLLDQGNEFIIYLD